MFELHISRSVISDTIKYFEACSVTCIIITMFFKTRNSCSVVRFMRKICNGKLRKKKSKRIFFFFLKITKQTCSCTIAKWFFYQTYKNDTTRNSMWTVLNDHLYLVLAPDHKT